MRQRLPAVPTLALFGRDRAPELVDNGARVAADLVDVAFEMGGPQSLSCVACERRVAGDDVDLGVVEEGVRVEVRGTERELAVVDDADLRVHIGALAGVARARPDGRGEEAPLVVVGFNEDA